MIPRFLNLQGMIGIAASLLLLGLFVVKAGDARQLAQAIRPLRAIVPRRA